MDNWQIENACRDPDYPGVYRCRQNIPVCLEVNTFILADNRHSWSKIFGIFTNRFLWLNRQSSNLASDVVRVEKIKIGNALTSFS